MPMKIKPTKQGRKSRFTPKGRLLSLAIKVLSLAAKNQKIGTNMNYATQELTASLQELTTKSERQPRPIEKTVPASISASDFSFSKEVESFLETTRDYSAKTRGVHVGIY